VTPALITDPPAGPLDVTRLGDLDTPTLRAALGDALRLTVRHLVYVAAIWKELEHRGEDLTPLRQGIGAYLPAIASGEVLAETVVNFAGRPGLLRTVAALPPAEQRAIADGRAAPPTVRLRGRLKVNLGTASRPLLPGQGTPPARPGREPNDEEVDAQAAAVEPRKPLEMLAAMIGQASPGDAAELVADCVRGCPTAQAVALRLIPLLQDLARAPVKRQRAV
jgi:hypothetical protein